VKIPEDVTIVGFDNIPMSSWNMFELTTAGVSLDEMAVTAVGLLMQRMEDSDRDVQRVVMEPQVTLRSTHGRPHDMASSNS